MLTELGKLNSLGFMFALFSSTFRSPCFGFPLRILCWDVLVKGNRERDDKGSFFGTNPKIKLFA